MGYTGAIYLNGDKVFSEWKSHSSEYCMNYASFYMMSKWKKLTELDILKFQKEIFSSIMGYSEILNNLLSKISYMDFLSNIIGYDNEYVEDKGYFTFKDDENGYIACYYGDITDNVRINSIRSFYLPRNFKDKIREDEKITREEMLIFFKAENINDIIKQKDEFHLYEKYENEIVSLLERVKLGDVYIRYYAKNLEVLDNTNKQIKIIENVPYYLFRKLFLIEYKKNQDYMEDLNSKIFIHNKKELNDLIKSYECLDKKDRNELYEKFFSNLLNEVTDESDFVLNIWGGY